MRTAALTYFLISLVPAAAADSFQAGAAMRVITPDPLLPVSGGMGPTAPVREKREELTARAVVFQQGEITVAFVCLDLLGFPSVLGNRFRSNVSRIPAENILIGSTHGHSSPDVYAFPDGRGGHTGNLEYMDFVCENSAEGKIAYNYYAPDLYDRRMSVIQAAADGTTIATIVNYAVHPEVLGPDVGILSPDLVGPLCNGVEAQVGGMAMFMNGAQGGMVTADNRDFQRVRDPQRGYWNDNRTWKECVRIGHTMADEALRIIRDSPLQQSPGLRCRSIRVTFPVESEEI